MRFARVAAAATALSLAGAATLVSPAHAATPGVGTSAASSSLLNIAVGTAGSVLNLKVLADDARSTIDPSVATPEAFSRLNALSLTSMLPAPLNNISLPVVESRSPGGQPSVAGPGLNLSSIGGVSLPVSLLGGVLSPASTFDASYTLEGLVNQLYADLRAGGQPATVFTMQVFVTRTLDRTIVMDRNYTHTVYVPNRSPQSVVKGLSEGFQQCLAELERDLRGLNLKP